MTFSRAEKCAVTYETDRNGFLCMISNYFDSKIQTRTRSLFCDPRSQIRCSCDGPKNLNDSLFLHVGSFLCLCVRVCTWNLSSLTSIPPLTSPFPSFAPYITPNPCTTFPVGQRYTDTHRHTCYPRRSE